MEMKIVNKRFAGKDFKAVQVVPLVWRVKWFLIFAIPAVVIFYFYPKMWEAARGPKGQSYYYLLMIVPLLLLLYAISRAALRVVVYTDPKDKKFVVVRAGLFLSKEKLNIGASDITGVVTETIVTSDRSDEPHKTKRKTKTLLVVKSNKGNLRLWKYSKAARAQQAARLIEQLLKS